MLPTLEQHLRQIRDAINEMGRPLRLSCFGIVDKAVVGPRNEDGLLTTRNPDTGPGQESGYEMFRICPVGERGAAVDFDNPLVTFTEENCQGRLAWRAEDVARELLDQASTELARRVAEDPSLVPLPPVEPVKPVDPFVPPANEHDPDADSPENPDSSHEIDHDAPDHDETEDPESDATPHAKGKRKKKGSHNA